MNKEIVKFLRKYDTVVSHMTDDECVEYFKKHYPNDYQNLIRTYGE